jgi:hypothetical protein
MQFLLIIAHDDAFVPTNALVADIRDWVAEMERRGIRVHGNPLRPPGEAITVRVRNGALERGSGPFSRSKEKICAYELIECETIEAAIGVASRHPMASAATIEVRPVWSELAR